MRLTKCLCARITVTLTFEIFNSLIYFNIKLLSVYGSKLLITPRTLTLICSHWRGKAERANCVHRLIESAVSEYFVEGRGKKKKKNLNNQPAFRCEQTSRHSGVGVHFFFFFTIACLCVLQKIYSGKIKLQKHKKDAKSIGK